MLRMCAQWDVLYLSEYTLYLEAHDGNLHYQ